MVDNVTIHTMMTMRINLSIIMLLLITTTTTNAQSPTLMDNFCGNSLNITTSFKTNVKNVLSWVTSDPASISEGYNYTVIGSNNIKGTNDAVYGLYSCRVDTTGYFCKSCLRTAASEIARRCPNSVNAIIWYDICIIRYSNERFWGKVSLSPTWNITGSRIIEDKSEIVKAESAVARLIIEATMEKQQFWAVEEFEWVNNEKRYGWVQCERSLRNDQCGQCLHAMLKTFPLCCANGTKIPWGVFGPSCAIRFDDVKFYFFLNSDGGTKMSRKLIILLCVFGIVTLMLCFSVYYFWYRRKVRKDKVILDEEETLNTDLPTISLISIQRSTNYFSEASKLGEGGYGNVYKGILPDGRQIAVKRLSKTSEQGSDEFKNEVMLIAKLQHRNLVRLLARCSEEDEKILVYEYMPNGSLYSHLFDYQNKKQLDWKLRFNIIKGIARGLLYLHEDSRLKIIHRDLKASNILLDHEMNPKISDFGLARAFEIGQSQANTKRIMGTYGYIAPEYAILGLFSVKSDVFSFGVLILEIISGRKNNVFLLSDDDHDQALLLHAWNIWCGGNYLELMDPILEKSFIVNEVVRCIHIGLLCVQQDAADRPTMSTVVLMLGSDIMSLPKPNHPALSIGKMTPNKEIISRSPESIFVNYASTSTFLPR